MKFRRIGGALLGAAMAFSLLGASVPVQAAERGSVSVNRILKHAEDFDSINAEFLELVTDRKSVSLTRLEEYITDYKLPMDYVQRLFDDCFVFRSGTGLEYIPIDEELDMNDYSWENLQQVSGNELAYEEEDGRRAVKGIDVSTYQGQINWKRVKADGVKFAFIRLGLRGYGTGKIKLDDQYARNIQQAPANGIKTGVYFYSQAVSVEEAVEEAEFVLEHIQGKKITYPVVYDIEDAPSANARTAGMSKALATDLVKAFCDTIEEAGYTPMVYANSKWFATRLDYAELDQYDKWLAQYYTQPFFPYDFQIWQYTGKGRVDGIQGNVDMNLAFVSY